VRVAEELRTFFAQANVQAFAHVVREGESSQDDAKAYFMRYGGVGQKPKFFADLSQHPKIFEPAPNGQKSSAAGAYQATWTTWSEEQGRWGWTDFSQQSQDEFFVARLMYRNALEAVIAGRFDEACRLCRAEWTSLPGGAEENAATRRARDTFLKWGGTLAGEPAPAQPNPEAPMLPVFAMAAIGELIKAAPDLIRIFGKGEQSQKNAVIAEKVVEVAKQVTGAVNEQQAVTAIQQDPAVAERFRQAVADNFDQWMGMVVKFAEMDEASRDKARTFVAAQPTVLGNFRFVEILSLVMVFAAILGGGYVLWDPQDKFTREMADRRGDAHADRRLERREGVLARLLDELAAQG
jgi:muramidase (phage lysozyme)